MSDETYGTAGLDAPVSRRDFERALRHLNLSDLELRDAILQLGARMVALMDELTRRIDHVEPDPAPPGTPAAPPAHTVEEAVAQAIPPTLAQVRAADVASQLRVSLDLGGDGPPAEAPMPPCAEVMHLCHARCCTFDFALSTRDLDAGVIRWDYGRPYLIRKRASDGYCVHNAPDDHRCTVHEHRPRVCRSYDCRKDTRIWTDFDRRIPAPDDAFRVPPEAAPDSDFDLMKRARARAEAVRGESAAVGGTYPDRAPLIGPRPEPSP